MRSSISHPKTDGVFDWLYNRPPPPKPVVFFDERLMTARHEDGCYGENTFIYFYVSNGLSNDYVGVARGTRLEHIRPDVGFQTCDFVKPC